MISVASFTKNLTELLTPVLVNIISTVSIGCSIVSTVSLINSNSIVNTLPVKLTFELYTESSTPFTNFFIETIKGKTFVNNC